MSASYLKTRRRRCYARAARSSARAKSCPVRRLVGWVSRRPVFGSTMQCRQLLAGGFHPPQLASIANRRRQPRESLSSFITSAAAPGWRGTARREGRIGGEGWARTRASGVTRRPRRLRHRTQRSRETAALRGGGTKPAVLLRAKRRPTHARPARTRRLRGGSRRGRVGGEKSAMNDI